MKIDHFDQYVLAQKGKPARETIKRLYGIAMGKANAEKQLAGIRRHIRHKLELGEDKYPLPEEMQEVVTKADGTITTKRMVWLSEEDHKNPSRVMYLMGYDPLQWQLVSCKTVRNDWDVTMKISQGNAIDGFEQFPHKETNHQYKCELTVKPIQDKLTSDTIQSIFDEMEAPSLIEYDYVHDSGLMLELPVMDFHIGQLSWNEDAGINWNYKKAVKLYKKSLTELLNRIEQYNVKVEKIVFPIGQDFFHFDTEDNKTTYGTQMETDSRWQKIFREGFELLVWAVENLRAIAPVEIFWVPGNHDEKFSYFAVCYLSAWFRNSNSVKINLSSLKRKYVKHGKCLIGFSHGYQEGKRIEKVMQVEASSDWGRTIYREFHLGHLHHERALEDGGVIIRNISCITATDSWHKGKGYVGAIRKMQGIIWDKEKGRQLTIDVNTSLDN